MSFLNPIDPAHSTPTPNQLSRLNPVHSIESFEKVIDHMVAEKLSHQGPSQAAIAAQQSLEEFRHKLAALTGMLEQAQIAMNSQAKRDGGPSGVDEQKYFLLKSKLSQVALPDGVNNLS